MNVQKSTACGGVTIKPNVTFSIEKTDGTVIQSYNTNNIATTASPTWLQFGFFFTTPVGVSDVVLRMRNIAPGGCGNDLALDDITFRRCGPLVSSTIVGTGTNSANVCQGSSQLLMFLLGFLQGLPIQNFNGNKVLITVLSQILLVQMH
jgi:hypothetical protein